MAEQDAGPGLPELRCPSMKDVLPAFDVPKTIRIWKHAAPPGVPVDSAVHSFVLD
jgi:hypothetical protein